MTQSGAILVLTHSRADLLADLLGSIQTARGADALPMVVVRQLGHDDVGDVVEKWRHRITCVIEMDGSAPTVAANISRNRLTGYAAVFEGLGVDWVLAVEDDVLIAADTLDFVAAVMSRHGTNRRFRGVNLGSRLSRSISAHATFCRVRFGVAGQASAMHVRTWRSLQRWKVLRRALDQHWDASFEAFCKTGFTIVPNNSRYVDRGRGGTHMQASADDAYFTDLQASFVGTDARVAAYRELQMGYWWRKDLRPYKWADGWLYWGVFLVTLLESSPRWRRLGSMIRWLSRSSLHRDHYS